MRTIDLRSDTVTKPTEEMRKFMANAEVGDDVFGEDPTIRELEETVAGILGKEAALFVPSGTMSNQIALSVLTNEGDEVYCDKTAHIFNYESGAPALIARVQLHPLEGNRGVFTREQVEEVLRPEDHHFAPSKLIVVENTSNRGGGTVWPIAEIRRLSELASEQGMSLHLDGARLWNAAAASGIKEAEWARHADTISVCFSKGLGAPVGSCLVGSEDVIDAAHRMRKRLGGGMRQAGIIAAGALYGVKKNRERLVEDHHRAKTLAYGISTIDGLEVDMEHVDTNIVFVDLHKRGLEADKFAETLASKGLLVTTGSRYKARLVTNLMIDDKDIEEAIQIITELYGE